MAVGYQGYGTPEQVRRRREIAEALAAKALRSGRAPQSIGDALAQGGSQFGAALASRGMRKKADEAEREGRESARGSNRDAIARALSGLSGGQSRAPVSPTRQERSAPVQLPSAPVQGLPYGMMDAVIQQESGGDPNAVSPKGATGIGQVMPATAREPGYGVPDIFDTARQLGREVPDESDATMQKLLRDPEVNKAFANNYMAAMHREQGGDIGTTLAAYNAGPGAVQQHGGVPPYAETQNYVQNVQGRMAQAPAASMTDAAPQQPVPQQPAAQPNMEVIEGLASVLQNPWSSEGDKAMAQMLLEQHMARMAPPEPTAGMREYEFARQNGYDGSFLDFVEAKKGGTNVTVNNQGDNMPQVGTIPQGFELRQTETGWQMAPIPGGPAEMEQKEAEAQREGQERLKERYGGVVLEDIGRARNLIENATLPTTGMGGSFLSQVPGTEARDLRAMVDTIKANVGFDRLQQMREASPTGGALGQVSEMENRLLQATLGNLEQSQTKEQFLYNLNRMEDLYLDIIHGPGNRPEMPNAEGGGDNQQVPEGVDPKLWQHMTPEERALWQN